MVPHNATPLRCVRRTLGATHRVALNCVPVRFVPFRQGVAGAEGHVRHVHFRAV